MKKNHLTLAALLLSASASHAALIAHYDFSDGTLLDDETVNGHTLTQSAVNGTGITFNSDGFSAHFDSSAGPNYLTTPLGLTGTEYTVSMWFKATSATPAGNSSIMSTNGTNDWQLEYNGEVQAVVRNVGTIGDGEGTQLTAGSWYHAVMLTDGTDATLYISEEGGNLTLIDTVTGDIAMDNLLIGVNRAKNLTWEGDYANIAIYDTALDTAALQTVLNAGPSAVPEPSSAALLGLGGLALILRRRK